MLQKNSLALRVSLIYLIFSFLWIYFSDKVLFIFTQNPDTLQYIQTLKGTFFIIITSVLLYILIKLEKNKEYRLQQQLQTIVEEAPNPIKIFNEDGEMLFINKVWLDITGYEYNEINTIEKWVNHAYPNAENSAIETIRQTCFSKQREDYGDWSIQTKNGSEVIWHFTAAPLGIIQGKRAVIASAMDITELKEKDKLMVQQSKMVAMGEMMENIAHQWRQPLSIISTISSSLFMQKNQKMLSDKMLLTSLNQIKDSTQYLSQTIDDFRDFFKPNKEKLSININDVFKKTYLLLESELTTHNIKVIKNIEAIEFLGFSSSLMQVFMNLIHNSKDAFEEKQLEKYIFINIYKEENHLIIKIKDNAGGIKEDIIHRIFEPYFTTKHKEQGTGIGLYMSQQIIEKHMMGTIEANSLDFKYLKKTYAGAEFTITLLVDV